MTIFKAWVPINGRVLIECKVETENPDSFGAQDEAAKHMHQAAREQGILMEALISNYEFDTVGDVHDIEPVSVIEEKDVSTDEFTVDASVPPSSNSKESESIADRLV